MTTEAPPRVFSLSEAADRLKMKRSNVAKFLARRNVQPAFAKAQGYFYWQEDIERVKREREADKQRMAADERRREGALRGRGEVRPVQVPPELARLGATQRALLSELLRHPVRPDTDAKRLALRRLRERGLADVMPDAPSAYMITPNGRAAAGHL